MKEFIINSFKCQIMYKNNFYEDIIPKNKTFLVEIKRGVDILDAKEQINIK